MGGKIFSIKHIVIGFKSYLGVLLVTLRILDFSRKFLYKQIRQSFDVDVYINDKIILILYVSNVFQILTV
jgi:hypothetical protein